MITGISKLHGMSVYERAMCNTQMETLPILLTRTKHHHPLSYPFSSKLAAVPSFKGEGGEGSISLYDFYNRIYRQHAFEFLHEYSCLAEYVSILQSDDNGGDNHMKAQRHKYHNCSHFPIVNNPFNMSLSGSLSRAYIKAFLVEVFSSIGLVNALHLLLADCVDDVFVQEQRHKSKGSTMRSDECTVKTCRPASVAEHLEMGGWGDIVNQTHYEISKVSQSRLLDDLENDDSNAIPIDDSDGEAFINLGVTRSASLPAMSTLMGKDKSSRSKLLTRHTNSMKNMYGSFTDNNNVHANETVVMLERGQTIATSAVQKCKQLLHNQRVNNLVDWDYVAVNLSLYCGSDESTSSLLADDDKDVQFLCEHLSHSFEELLQFDDFSHSQHFCGESVTESAGQLSSCCDQLTGTIMTLLRSPVHLSTTGRLHIPHPFKASFHNQSFPLPIPSSSTHIEAFLWPAASDIVQQVSVQSRSLAAAVNRSPFSIPAHLPLEELCILTEMIQSEDQFVTSCPGGELLGIVTREGLLAALKETLDNATGRRKPEFGKETEQT